MAPRRFLKGVTNVSADSNLGRMPFMDPTKYAIAYEDFFGPWSLVAAGVSNGTTTWVNNWFIRSEDANATVSQTTDADANGVAKVALAAADNSVGWGQALNDNAIRMRTGKKLFFSCKFEITHTAGTVNNQEMFVGLAENTMTSWSMLFNAAGTGIVSDDTFGFLTLDGGASIYFTNTENDSGYIVDTGKDIETGRWFEMAVYWDGTNIELFCDGWSLGKYASAAAPTTGCSLTFGCKNGEAKARNLLVDYMFLAIER